MIHVKFWRSLASAMSHGETPKKIMCSIKAETRKPEGLLVMLQAVFNLKPKILNAAILGNHSKLKNCLNLQMRKESKVGFYLKYSNKLKVKS